MLQHKAVIIRRDFLQRQFQLFYCELRRLITIRMRVHLNAFGQRKFVYFLHLLGRDIPKAIGCTVVIPGPTHPRREPLNGTISHDLDPPKRQTIRREFLETCNLWDQLFRGKAKEKP